MACRKLLVASLVAALAVCSNAAKSIESIEPKKDSKGCFIISSAAELYGFANAPVGDFFSVPESRCAKLTQDIVVNRGVLTGNYSLNVNDTANFIPWTPIERFRGVFDGQGHKISGLYQSADSLSGNVGLFGELVTSEADTVIIRNLVIDSSYFGGGDKSGAFVASVEPFNYKYYAHVLIENCTNNSLVVAKTYYPEGIGGIVGYVNGRITIRNCANHGVVKGDEYVGGIVGTLNLSEYHAAVTSSFKTGYASIEKCFNSGRVESRYEAGGIVGSVEGTAQIRNSYNVGDILEGTSGPLGGIVGRFRPSCDAYLVNVYNAGQIKLNEEYPYGQTKPIVGYVDVGLCADGLVCENVFFRGSSTTGGACGVQKDDSHFRNGSVAYQLRNYYFDGVDGSVWGQKVGTDSVPVFSGSIEGASAITFASLTLHTFDGDTTVYPEKYEPGYAFRLPPVNRDGYVFRGWFNNSAFTGDSIDFVPATATGEQEFWAKFNKISSVTLVLASGPDSSFTGTYVEGFGTSLPESAERDGYIFRGWYASEDYSGARVSKVGAMETGDKVFYAKWFKKQMPLTLEKGCYVIHDANELYGFADLVNDMGEINDPNDAVCAVLANDIVVNENVLDEDGMPNEPGEEDFLIWTPIDNFFGVFDGRNHVISGLFYVAKEYSGRYEVGLFGTVDKWTSQNPVVIKNLGVVDSYFESAGYVGAFVGRTLGYQYEDDSSHIFITNCYSNSTVYSPERYGADYVGGFVGFVDKFTTLVMENTYNTGRTIVERYASAGGLVGDVEEMGSVAIIRNSYNVGPIENIWEEEVGYSLVGSGEDYSRAENSFYLEFDSEYKQVGIPVTSEQFADGSVAISLHAGANGSIWGQEVGTDPLPNFSGKVKNSTLNTYKVTFHTFDDDTASYFESYVESIGRDLPDTVEREGYYFKGWYSDTSYSGTAVKSIGKDESGDKEFFAKWEGVPIEVTWRSNNNLWGVVQGLNADGIYHYNDTVYAVPVALAGYKFEYWAYPMNEKDSVVSFVATHDTTVIAVFGVLGSSTPKSSSSAKSSSSSAKSSSSKKVASSSSSAPKSSSGKANSSSSCGGKKCKSDALPAYGAIPQFSLSVMSRSIRVDGAVVGKPYALLDAQGKVVSVGYVATSSFELPVSGPGMYLVRIGGVVQGVTVR